MVAYKVKNFVRHKWFGQDIPMQIVQIEDNHSDCIYTCRYFSNGIFHSANFYEHELVIWED